MRIAWLALFGILCLSVPFPIQAGNPTDKIRVAIEQGIQILNDPELRSKNGKKGQIDRLREIVYPLFDFLIMARRSLGQHWRQRTPKEKQEFVPLFTNLLEISYAGKIDLYEGERVVFTSEVVDGTYAQVDSNVINKKGEKFSVSYKLLLTDGDWRIYDVVVANISMVNNYRSQFNRVIANFSYEELIRRMKQKTERAVESHRVISWSLRRAGGPALGVYEGDRPGLPVESNPGCILTAYIAIRKRCPVAHLR